MRILIADDNALNRKLIARQLETSGHTVLKAGDGAEALELLRREPVDAVVSDIFMPVMDGYRLCHEIRHTPALASLPVVFYTATFDTPSDQKLAYDMGADRYLTKPATVEDILAVLDEVTRSRRTPLVPQRVEDELYILKEYNERLVEKMEEKNIELTEAFARLKASEERYRMLADAGQALIWVADTDQRCTYFNRVWLEFTGRTLEQEVGDGWVEGVHPDDRDDCMAAYEAAFDRRERFSLDYRLRRHDGVYRWIQDDGTPTYTADGGFTGYIGHGLDVSVRREAEDVLRSRAAELEQFHRMSVGRELQMIELKKQVNAFAAKAGEPPPYDLGFLDAAIPEVRPGHG